jgi:Tol biopolymer transport system component
MVMRIRLNDEPALAVRDFDEPAMRVIPGTEYASNPALSPDGEWLLYRSENTAYKRLIAGGPAIEICEVDAMLGGVLETDDSIILAPSNLGPLHRVSAAGGEPEPLYEIDGSQPVSDRHPSLLPDGRGVLFHRCRGDSADGEDWRLRLLSLEGGSPASCSGA